MMVLVIIVLVIIIFVIYEFNIFISLKNKLNQSKSTIDIYLTQRFDLIPNLVECVKGYSKYEAETLKSIASLRESYNNTKDLQIGQNLTNQMNDIICRAEEVPNLKANEQFMMLQKSLIKMESQLQAARRVYNGDVTLYNITIQTFPNNLIANLFKMKQVELFTIDEYKINNIEVDI